MIKVFHQVENDQTVTVIEFENGVEIRLYPGQVAQLRDLLNACDEHAAPAPGMPYTHPRKKPDGSIVTHYDGTPAKELTSEDLDRIDPTYMDHPIWYISTYAPDVENWDNPAARFPEWSWNLNDESGIIVRFRPDNWPPGEEDGDMHTDEARPLW